MRSTIEALGREGDRIIHVRTRSLLKSYLSHAVTVENVSRAQVNWNETIALTWIYLCAFYSEVIEHTTALPQQNHAFNKKQHTQKREEREGEGDSRVIAIYVFLELEFI